LSQEMRGIIPPVNGRVYGDYVDYFSDLSIL
jgi:hypothetical protein